jgi:hypothetical protein
MARPKTKVELAIEEFEQAREDYRRQQRREGISKILQGDLTKIPVVVENLKNEVTYLFSSALAEPNASEGARRKFFEKMNLVPSDLDIPSAEIPAATLKMYQAMVRRNLEDVADIEKAYETTIAELRDKANPFHDGQNQARFSAFMQELSLIGGPAKRPEDLVKQVKQAIADRDPGALQFWSRNLETLTKQNPGMLVGDRLHLEKLGRDVNELIASKRTSEQRYAAERARAIETAWEANGMEKHLFTAKLQEGDLSRFQSYDSLPSYLKPRPRTEREEKTAAGRALLREGEGAEGN